MDEHMSIEYRILRQRKVFEEHILFPKAHVKKVKLKKSFIEKRVHWRSRNPKEKTKIF